MKIKTGLFGTIHNVDSKKDSSKTSVGSSPQNEKSDGVSLSVEGAFIQTLRQAAKGEEPLRSDLIEQAKQDLANGLLGTEEDFEQAVNALLQEL